MRRTRSFGKILAVAIAICLSAPGGLSAAPPEGKGKPEKAYKHAPKNAAGKGSSRPQSLISASIGVQEARRMALGHHYVGFGPLPPGIRKNLARGKPLPPGIAKKLVPQPMLAQLPRFPGYEWRVCGSDLVLVAIATAVIADVLFDVFQ
jgi:hypothetical protein